MRVGWIVAAAATGTAGLVIACSGGDKTTGPGGAGALSTVVVTPDSATLAVGGQQTFTATGKDAKGRTVSGLTFFWSSNSDSLATVTQSGQVTAVKPGNVKIAASVQGVSGLSAVTVIPKAVGAVIVVPTSATIRIATTLQLTDTVKDVSGAVVTNIPVTWSSDSSPLVSVDGNGLVTGRKIGTAHITASAGGKSATATITVSQIPVASITITPNNPTVSVGQSTQLTAVTKDSAGTVLPGRVVRWKSQNAATASIDSISGLLAGVAAGSTSITATSEGVTSSVTATVNPAPVNSVVLSPNVAQLRVGQTQQLTATVTDVNGNPVSGATVTFTSNNTSIASVSSATATAAQILAGPNTGTATITGTSGVKTGTATIIVSLVPVDSVHVTASQDTLTVGHQDTLTATAFDSTGAPLSGRPITWRSSNAAVATVNGAGIVTTVRPGTVVMFATISGVTGSVTLVVNPVPVGSVTVAPASDTVLQGGQRQLSVTVRDSLGNIVTNPQVSWSTSNGTATVNGTGLVTGVSPGTDTIIAQSGTKSGTNITVVAPPVASVIVAPSTTSINTAQTAQLTDTLKDAGGNVLTGRPVTWSSNNTAKATVSQAGLVTPHDTGTVTITVTATQPSGNVSGTASVTITAVPVASVVVFPGPDTIYATTPVNTVQLRDSTYDAGHRVLTGRTVTWSPTSGGVATVDAAGLVTATNTDTGSATIKATSADGPSGSTTVVVLGHSATVNVNAGSTTLDSSGTPSPSSTTATAQILDSFGTDVSGRVVTWTSSDTSTVTINGSTLPVIGPASTPVTLQVVSTASGSVTIKAAVTDGTTGATTSGTTTLTIGP
jgi:trimeric autotransporter adhesin